MVTHAFVDDLAFSLGSLSFDIKESETAGRLTSTAADLGEAGFHTHHVCEPGATSYDLAKQAVARIGTDQPMDAVVYSTCLPHNGSVSDLAAWESTKDVKHLMDFPASRLQADMDLGTPAVFGLNQQGCTGMLGALRLAGALLAAEPDWQRVLCLAADRFPAGAVYEQSYNVISDGAAACVVSARPAGLRLVACHQITNGGLHAASNDETVGTFFSYVPQLVRQTVARAGLGVGDLDWVVPQNTNRNAWQLLARLLGLDAGRVWQSSLADIGHAISADNIINLKALLETGRVRPGQYILLVMAGHGLNWQAVILEATERIA
jgi:3-oxoacyl-[acyl-carrier-protein] synthase-3